MPTYKEEAEKWANQYYGYDDPRIYAVKRAFEAGMECMEHRAKLAFISCGNRDKKEEFLNKLKE